MEGTGTSPLKRLGVVAFLLLVVMFVCFMLLHVGGIAPAQKLAGPDASPDAIAQVQGEYGLNQPLPVQFVRYLLRTLSGDLGRSWLTGNTVGAELLARLPATIELLLYGFLLGVMLGLPLGLLAALGPGQQANGLPRFIADLLAATPSFLLALALLLLFVQWLGISPVPNGRISVLLTPPSTITGSMLVDSVLAQDGAATRSALAHLALPLACIVLVVAARLAGYVRVALDTTMTADHIAYARAQGMPPDMVTGMVVRGTMPTIGTAISRELAGLFMVVAVVEHVFVWGGLGQFGLDAIIRRDFAVVQGVLLLVALFSMLVLGIAHLVTLALRRRTQLA